MFGVKIMNPNEFQSTFHLSVCAVKESYLKNSIVIRLDTLDKLLLNMIKPYLRGQEPRVRVGSGWVFSFVIGRVNRLRSMNALTISYK